MLALYWFGFMWGFMSPTQGTEETSQSRLATKPRTTPAADWSDALFDQLDRLIIDKNSRGCWYYCECDLCKRYWAVHDLLMQCFPTSQRKPRPDSQDKAQDKSQAKAQAA